MSTQNVNVARFARNVEWDVLCDFQTPCLWSKMRVITADTFTSLFSSQLSSPAIKSRFIGLHYNLFFARASKSICLEFLETGRQANDHQVFETLRGSTRKMNDIAKLTQELEYVRSISNPSHLKPYSKKRGLFQSYYISWVMKKYAMISTLDEASIKKNSAPRFARFFIWKQKLM